MCKYAISYPRVFKLNACCHSVVFLQVHTLYIQRVCAKTGFHLNFAGQSYHIKIILFHTCSACVAYFRTYLIKHNPSQWSPLDLGRSLVKHTLTGVTVSCKDEWDVSFYLSAKSHTKFKFIKPPQTNRHTVNPRLFEEVYDHYYITYTCTPQNLGICFHCSSVSSADIIITPACRDKSTKLLLYTRHRPNILD